MRTVYLDNNATTAVAPEVLDAMLPFLRERYGNPSSAHTFGGAVAKDIERAREQVADLLGAEPTEILFTSCGTESDSTAIRSCLERYPGRRRVVTSCVEHPAVRSLCHWLKEQGYLVTELGVDSGGRLDMAEVDAAVTEETAVCSIMWANNETGVLFPVEEIARLCKSRAVPFHTDAVQTAGKVPIDLSDGAIDMLALSGHKFHAPKGVGALYVRRGARFYPLLRGGHQERGRRAGTESVASIVGLGKAAELAKSRLEEENTRVRALRDRLEAGLLERIADSFLNGDRDARVPNTTNIGFQYVEGEAILLLLDQLGIAASSGSACTSGSLEPSHVLRAMGVPFMRLHGSIRFSLSVYNTDADVDDTLEHVPGVIQRLRDISPFTPPREMSGN